MLVWLIWIWASFVVKEKVDSPKKQVEDLELERQLPNVPKRSGIVKLLAARQNQGCLATFLEQKTRFYLAFKISNRAAKAMFSAIKQLCKLFPKEAIKTFASDRRKEFSYYPLIANLGISFFFADAYSSWQRGSNENANGLPKEYFQKKMDLTTISYEALNKALYDINHLPRKYLSYRTACEALMDELE